MKTRKTYSAEFKTKLALEVITNRWMIKLPPSFMAADKEDQEISGKLRRHGNSVRYRKQKA
jgi:hypothetical protein